MSLPGMGKMFERIKELEAERDELKSKLAYATLGFDKLVVERDALRQRCEGMHTYCLRNEVFFLRPDGTFQHIPQNLWEDLAAQEKEKL